MTINDPRDDPKYQVGGNKYKAAFESNDGGIPANIVNDFHKKSDVDSSAQAQHHTLGSKHDQASPGDHTHNGTNSLALLDGVSITGSRASGAALISVIDALERLGATDATIA